MKKLGKTLSPKLRKITDLERCDHARLRESDECFFFGEYAPRAGWNHSETNGFIYNLKKPMQKKGLPEWKYKTQRIRQLAEMIKTNLPMNSINDLLLVPMPPSKPVGHPEHDNRMSEVCRLAAPFRSAAILSTAVERTAKHVGYNSRNIEELMDTLSYDPSVMPPGISTFIVIDDVLTTGTSFVAAKTLIQDSNPGVHVIGIFAARCVWDQAASYGFTAEI
jgi:predicted amidophosphoribosyltransferase